MSARVKRIPKFKNEAAEREFWHEADSTEYIDWSSAAEALLPKLKPTLRTISIRLPEAMIAQLKLLANKQDVAYQALVKTFLADRIKTEISPERPAKNGRKRKERAA
jgi:predicted DNA binding CopG/RHH family protein